MVIGQRARVGLYTSTVLRTEGGQAVGTLCVFDAQPRPVTETQVRMLRIIAGQIITALELRASSLQLAGLAGQVSHDLNAPLTAILGFTEVLLGLQTVTADPAVSSYERCRSSGLRMLDSIEDLRNHARG